MLKFFKNLFGIKEKKIEMPHWMLMDIRKAEADKMWPIELLEWISNENDPIKLAVASHKLNCYEWPDWLPGKPNGYPGQEFNTGVKLQFIIDVMDMLKKKAEKIQPGLEHKIWMSGSYQNYKHEDSSSGHSL